MPFTPRIEVEGPDGNILQPTAQGEVSIKISSVSLANNPILPVSIGNEVGLLQDTIDKLMALRPVSINNFPAIQDVQAQGTVSLASNTIADLKAIQDVQGSVSISNLPVVSLNQVTVDQLKAIQDVQGSVSISNLPVVSLNQVTIDQLKEVQDVQGSVSISNEPNVFIKGGISNIRADVTPAGNLKVGLFDSQTNARQIVDLNGAAKTGVATILAGDCLFGQDLSPFLWKSVELNGGTTTGGNGEQLLETGAAADGQVILQSVKKSRFMISQFNINHFGIQLNPTDLQLANTVYEWGSVDFIDAAGAVNASPNGVFIRVTSGATPAWEVVTVKDGVETAVPQASWTGTNAALFNPLPSLSVYEMQYNAGTAFFFQGANFLHRIAGLTSTYASTYSFPVALRIRNVGTVTGSRTLASRAAGTYRLGIERGELISRAFTTADYNVAGGILIKTGSGYVGKASLSRDGNAQTGGKVRIFDGTDNTGILIGQIDVSGTDLASITMDGTFSDGLFLEIDPSNNTDNTVTINFE